MGVSAFGWMNAVKTAALSATSAEVALPVSNLANDQGAASMGWQTLGGALTPTLTITPAARTVFRACGAFRTNLTATGTITVSALTTDPGSIPVVTSATFVNGQAVALFSADVAADSLQIAFSDPTNPDGHLNVPLIYAGPLWYPTTAMSWASTMGRDDVTDTVVTRGGQTYVNMRATFRRWEIALDGIRTTEAYPQLDVLDRVSRVGGNVLGIADTTSANMRFEATFGMLKATADVSFPLGTAIRRSWRARLSERL
jgi:hypothetical protein